MKTEECKDCGKRFKVLTEEGICFYCYRKKHKKPPTKGCYDPGKGGNNPMKMKKKKERSKKKKKKGMGRK
jgi:hypothetical protein